MYNCIIVDDEPIAIRVIKNHLSSFHDFKIAAECRNAIEAIPILTRVKVDLIFCDIQMPQMTGIEFIRSLSSRPKIIFISAFRDYAIEAFELNVVDYLLKPVSFERFAKAIQNFLQLVALEDRKYDQGNAARIQGREFIFLKADKKLHKLNLDDIVYIESMADYILVYTKLKKIVSKERIGAIAGSLPQEQFLQIHRRYIISVSKIDSVGPGFVEINNKKLPVGRSFQPKLSQFLQQQ